MYKKDVVYANIILYKIRRINMQARHAARELALIQAKATYEMLMNKASNIIEYINVIKLNKKISF